MTNRHGALWIASLTFITGCIAAGSTTSPRANYARAGGGLAFGVAAAAVNRAITGDCWANCALPNTFCNHKTGLCEKREIVEDIWVPHPTVAGEQGMGLAPGHPGTTDPGAEEAADAGTSPDAGSSDASTNSAPPR